MFLAAYEPGDYVKVEFEGENGLPGEWMWVRVIECDDKRRIILGTLDNEPVLNAGELHLGQQLAVSYGKVREHRKSWEFRKN
jgi:hypothetical protein